VDILRAGSQRLDLVLGKNVFSNEESQLVVLFQLGLSGSIHLAPFTSRVLGCLSETARHARKAVFAI